MNVVVPPEPFSVPMPRFSLRGNSSSARHNAISDSKKGAGIFVKRKGFVNDLLNLDIV